MKTSVLLDPHKENLNVSTHTLSLPGSSRNRTGNRVSQLGNSLVTEGVVRDLTRARLLLSLSDRPRHRSGINNNYCVSSVAGSSVNACVTGKEACFVNSATGSKNCVNVTGEELYTGNQDCFTTCKEELLRTLTVNFNVANHVYFVSGLPQRKGVIPNCCHLYPEIKHVQGVSCVNQLSSVQNETNVPPVVPDLRVGTRLHQFWEKWAALGVSPKVLAVLREGYTLPFRFRPNLTRNPTITSCYVNPQRNSYLLEALHQLLTSSKSTVPGFFQPVIPCTQTQQPVATYLGSEQTEQLLENAVIQNGDPRDYKDLPPGRGVGYVHRFQRRVLPHPNKQSVQEVHALSHSGQDLSFQSTTLWSVHSPHGVYSGGQRGQITSNERGYKNPPVPRRLVGQSQIPPNLSSTHTQALVALCRELGWLVNKEKSELEPKQVFNFVGYQFDLKEGRVRPTPERWQTLQAKIRQILSSPVCPVRNFMSLIGLLTATEKQVHLGRLHMRPIQWHLKNNWRVPETLEKTIPIPKSLHPHLKWWLEESNVITGQPLYPLKHALQIFKDASKEGWGAHLNEHMARGSWSLPESKLHINYLELKAVLLALKEFQALCTNNIVLIATDNTTVVAYINKEGGMKSGPLCALLWRILTWCTRNTVTLKARHIPGRLNVIADKLSRLGQTIQTEWSLNPEVFQAICSRWYRPQVDLFATRFNNKLPQFVSPVPDPQVWAVDALSLSWDGLDPYAFPPAAILGKVVEMLLDYPCSRMILIAPGWPNMPWFWDLVAMSSQIPLCLPSLPSLVTQPFNQILYKNLSNLNLHAWLVEPQQSRSRASLRQWQHELRLLKEDQPDQSMRQSGPFLQSGASLIRWTSGHRL